MTHAIIPNPCTGTVLTGPLPTHAAWDPITQTFAYVAPADAQDADAQTRAQVATWLAELLDSPPKARKPYKTGMVTLPPFRLACKGCKGTEVQVPIQASLAEDGTIRAWFGKGTCTCPTCGHTDTSVHIRNYSMYEYSDLISARRTQAAAILARFAPQPA